MRASVWEMASSNDMACAENPSPAAKRLAETRLILKAEAAVFSIDLPRYHLVSAAKKPNTDVRIQIWAPV